MDSYLVLHMPQPRSPVSIHSLDCESSFTTMPNYTSPTTPTSPTFSVSSPSSPIMSLSSPTSSSSTFRREKVLAFNPLALHPTFQVAPPRLHERPFIPMQPVSSSQEQEQSAPTSPASTECQEKFLQQQINDVVSQTSRWSMSTCKSQYIPAPNQSYFDDDDEEEEDHEDLHHNESDHDGALDDQPMLQGSYSSSSEEDEDDDEYYGPKTPTFATAHMSCPVVCTSPTQYAETKERPIRVSHHTNFSYKRAISTSSAENSTTSPPSSSLNCDATSPRILVTPTTRPVTEVNSRWKRQGVIFPTEVNIRNSL